MADFGEYLPVDCVLHDGDPALLHNRWPVLWAKLNREAIEEAGASDAFFFMRSGYLGIRSIARLSRCSGKETVHLSPKSCRKQEKPAPSANAATERALVTRISGSYIPAGFPAANDP